jgi:hypothetical protein
MQFETVVEDSCNPINRRRWMMASVALLAGGQSVQHAATDSGCRYRPFKEVLQEAIQLLEQCHDETDCRSYRQQPPREDLVAFIRSGQQECMQTVHPAEVLDYLFATINYRGPIPIADEAQFELLTKAVTAIANPSLPSRCGDRVRCGKGDESPPR